MQSLVIKRSPMSYLIQIVPFFGIFIRDSLPCRITFCTADESEKRNDNAVKTRQGDKINEKKKKQDRAVQESGYWWEGGSERKKVEQVIVQRSQLRQLYWHSIAQSGVV